MSNIGAYLVVAAIAALVTLFADGPARIISLRGWLYGVARRAQGAPTHHALRWRVVRCSSASVSRLLFAFLIPSLRAIITSSHEMLGVLLAAGVIFVVGVVDDFRDMVAPAKVAGQFLAASILYFSGCDDCTNSSCPSLASSCSVRRFCPSSLPCGWLRFQMPSTSSNGLDGLAAGIVAIASATLCVYGLRLEDLGLLPDDQCRSTHRGADVWDLSRIPARQFPSGRSSSWATRGRYCSGS